MNYISCKLKNSFAIDNRGHLYTWGSSENGLLGTEDSLDVVTPMNVQIKNNYNTYLCEGVSSSHFHAAVVAKRISNSNRKSDDDLKYAIVHFDNLRNWYDTVFIKKISSVESFIKLLVMYTETMVEGIRFDDFEKLFLVSFFSHQTFNKKEIYNMKGTYKEAIFTFFKISIMKPFIQVDDLFRLGESGIPKIIKEIYIYASNMIEHFKTFPDDFPYFIEMILGFSNEVNEEAINTLFKYPLLDWGDKSKNEGNTIGKTIFEKLKKINNKVDSNELIDKILRKEIGGGAVFTWGSYSEKRLGYKDGSIDVDDYDLSMQYIPKIVRFPDPLTVIKKVACGYSHTLALSSHGVVFSWGSGKYGCLGNSSSEDSVYPSCILMDYDKKEFRNITDIGAGMYFSLALNHDNLLYSWGCGTAGRLGHGDENSVGQPKIIRYFEESDLKINKFSAGDTHCAAISNGKELFTWGNGSFGKLGHGDNKDMKLPLMLDFFSNKKVETIICGSGNTMVITTDSRIYSWGKNSDGMLGIPNMVGENIYIPTEIIVQKDEGNVVISKVSLGTYHTMFLSTDGSIFTCGNSKNGVLGREDIDEKLLIPNKIPGVIFYKTLFENIRNTKLFDIYTNEFTVKIESSKFPTGLKYITCSGSNTAYITNNDDLYMSGDSSLILKTENISKMIKTSQGGNNKNSKKNDSTRKFNPAKIIHPLISGKVTYVAVGMNHVICIANKNAYSWGSNVYGALGLKGKSYTDRILEPSLIDKITSSCVMACVSDSHSMILTVSGEIYTFGSNLYGKLGIGNPTKFDTGGDDSEISYELEPKNVRNITVAEYISCSNYHSACIMRYSLDYSSSYSIYTWGGAYGGKLGHYEDKDCWEPQIVNITDYKSTDEYSFQFIQLALGDEFSLALDIQGHLWGWGKKKYLLPNSWNDEGIITTPRQIYAQNIYKYVSCSSTFALVVDINGKMYAWGKILSLNEDNYKFKTFDSIFDNVELVACGVNHFAAIDSQNHAAYTWGNNLFYKCGQSFLKPGENETIFEQPVPKKIEYFFDKFIKNTNILKEEVENQLLLETKKESKNEDIRKDSRNNILQVNLLEESLDLKNLGILCEDYKLNIKFYQAMEDLFNTLNSVEQMKMKIQIETENVIISVLNKSNSIKYKDYISSIPKIISKNFQLYEAFLTIIQMHPCSFLKVQRKINNKLFMELIKKVYGWNLINMRNPRVVYMLTGLWNSIYSVESSDETPNNIKDANNYENFISFELYYLIFQLCIENDNIVYDLLADLFIFYLHKILSNNKDFVDPNKDKDILFLYSSMQENKRDNDAEAIKLICKHIISLFSDINDNSRKKFSSNILWIYKRIMKSFSVKGQEKEVNFENFSRMFNYFLFIPFIKVINSIINCGNDQSSTEYITITRKITERLEIIRRKGEYTELFNLYQTHREILTNNYFKKICSSNSDVLKRILDIFINLSKSEKMDEEKTLKNMNDLCSENLKKYKYDFTLSALKEFIKTNTEHGNNTINVSLTIKDLIQLQKSFFLILGENQTIKSENLLEIILDRLSNLRKTEELDVGSNIRNYVLNFYIKPNSFFYQTDHKSIIRCSDCMLPINSLFFDKDYIEKCIKGSSWKCQCGKENDSGVIKCLNCFRIKSTNKQNLRETFFKQFKVPHEDELTQLYEDTLFYMPITSATDDLIKEVKKERDRLSSQKEMKEVDKINLFQNFLDAIENEVGPNEDNAKFLLRKNTVIRSQYIKASRNYEKRQKHLRYIKTGKDLIQSILTNSEKAKSNFTFIQNQNINFLKNIKNGFTNSFMKNLSSTPKIKESSDRRNTIQRFFLIDLINRKIIDEVLFENQKQNDIMLKCFVIFEKEDDGYTIKLNYREKNRKYILCGIETEEYIINENILTNNQILEMRKNARHNPTWNSKDIRFNVFYLVKLINKLETEY